MKKMMFVLAAALVCTLSAEPVELLTNRDFAQQANGKITGWKVNNAGTFTAKSPTASFVFVPHSWGYNMLYTDLNGVQAKVPGQPLCPKGVYRLSVRAKGKGHFQLGCMVQFGTGSDWKFIRTVCSPARKLSDEFTDYAWDFTVADANANMGQFSILLWKNSSMEFENPSMTFDPEKNPSIKDPGFVPPAK